MMPMRRLAASEASPPIRSAAAALSLTLAPPMRLTMNLHRQKWSNMANLGRSNHTRWRGVALGGHLQRGCRFCLASQGGQATTGQIAEWCRPEIVYAGGKPTAIQVAKHARALRSIGAKRVRREGRQWVWRLGDSSTAG